MKIKNLKIRKKVLVLLSAGAIAISVKNCNTKHYKEGSISKVAVIFGDNTATIIEIKRYSDYDFGSAKTYIELKDGSSIITTANDTKIIKNKTYEEIEELAKNIMGEDVTINYYNCENIQSKTKKKIK